MIDRQQRDRLRDCLAKLVEGQLTNDQFDDLHNTLWVESSDRGVAAVAEFGFGLYSSDLPLPYRLEGAYAPDAETKNIAGRCLSFLATDQEYAWPEHPVQTLECAFGGVSLFLVMPLGAVLIIGGIFDVKFAAAGVLVSLVGYGLWRASRRTNTPEWGAYWAAGDKEAWPFLHRAECDLASNSCRK
jgi:hypothetical protein